jgi:hypothetical protein
MGWCNGLCQALAPERAALQGTPSCPALAPCMVPPALTLPVAPAAAPQAQQAALIGLQAPLMAVTAPGKQQRGTPARLDHASWPGLDHFAAADAEQSFWGAVGLQLLFVDYTGSTGLRLDPQMGTVLCIKSEAAVAGHWRLRLPHWLCSCCQLASAACVGCGGTAFGAIHVTHCMCHLQRKQAVICKAHMLTHATTLAA